MELREQPLKGCAANMTGFAVRAIIWRSHNTRTQKMSKPNRVFFAAFLAVAWVHATPASAGSAAYLSHAGSGSTCSQGAPCITMATALVAAGLNGEVICLVKGNY